MIRLVCSNRIVYGRGGAPEPFWPRWMRDIAIDLSEVPRPEWCEVCADFDINQVPERATTSRVGVACCSSCAASWDLDVSGPTVVLPFETMAAVVRGNA